MSRFRISLLIAGLFCVLGVMGFAQTPAPSPPSEERETILTEEIKLNVSAYNASGQFVEDLVKEDLVIVEDGRLQQANVVRRAPANVLILLDTGGAMRSNLSVTRAAAKKLIESFEAGDSVSVFQFGDKVDMLSGWTSDKAAAADVLDKKLTFGRRSVLNNALEAAVKFFNERPLENRHLVLVTSGLDSFNDKAVRGAAVAKLMSTDINVHVISYTRLQKDSIAPQKSIYNEGEWKPRRLPEEVVETLPDPKRPGVKDKDREITQKEIAKMPRLGGVTLDIERYKKARADSKELDAAAEFLAAIAEDTNGLYLLPETADELTAKAAALARTIDSQYVVAYTPKRPLKGSPVGEVRQIEVSSRRQGVRAEARRKLMIENRP